MPHTARSCVVLFAVALPSDHVLVVHGVRRVWEIFAATKHGEKQESSTPTKIGAW
jgi:hypothetical protein